MGKHRPEFVLNTELNQEGLDLDVGGRTQGGSRRGDSMRFLWEKCPSLEIVK